MERDRKQVLEDIKRQVEDQGSSLLHIPYADKIFPTQKKESDDLINIGLMYRNMPQYTTRTTLQRVADWAFENKLKILIDISEECYLFVPLTAGHARKVFSAITSNVI